MARAAGDGVYRAEKQKQVARELCNLPRAVRVRRLRGSSSLVTQESSQRAGSPEEASGGAGLGVVADASHPSDSGS